MSLPVARWDVACRGRRRCAARAAGCRRRRLTPDARVFKPWDPAAEDLQALRSSEAAAGCPASPARGSVAQCCLLVSCKGGSGSERATNLSSLLAVSLSSSGLCLH